MSRIGNSPITVPDNVEVKIDGLDLSMTKIEDISLTIIRQQYASAILKCDNGKVYGCGQALPLKHLTKSKRKFCSMWMFW